ncbi:hypothetical protein BFP70_05160 [Thioclava sp. SK-1]|uniref:sulfotransferase family 2 domain-containing protein n=1 Tax=Thioclava sp. SK-1 TaxID=1889770 RepID=UPI0008257C6D|nr:sulfotransferase family 2 domain-containing protein [Thioclava sp. SK-1]OCX66413.1 hypothetical protein BFP70_05160 [Thioclava sp. SK-1]
MPLIRSDARAAYFAHCPKAGGTSVEMFLIDNYPQTELYDGDWHSRRLAGERRDPAFDCSPQHLTWADAQGQLSVEPDLVFGIVRDPVKRMISEYKFQRMYRKRLFWLTRLGFSTWLHVVLAAARRDPYVLDNHLRPQVAFLPEHAQWFKLEDGLDPVRDAVVACLGLGQGMSDIPHSLKGASPGQAVRPARADLALITQAFAADYDRFGYARPDLSSAPDDGRGLLRQAVAACLSPVLCGLYRAQKL